MTQENSLAIERRGGVEPVEQLILNHLRRSNITVPT